MYPTFFFFNATPPPEIYTLSLHDALPICCRGRRGTGRAPAAARPQSRRAPDASCSHRAPRSPRICARSEEHTSELQSQFHLVCRLLLEKKKQRKKNRREVDHDIRPADNMR